MFKGSRYLFQGPSFWVSMLVFGGLPSLKLTASLAKMIQPPQGLEQFGMMFLVEFLLEESWKNKDIKFWNMDEFKILHKKHQICVDPLQKKNSDPYSDSISSPKMGQIEGSVLVSTEFRIAWHRNWDFVGSPPTSDSNQQLDHPFIQVPGSAIGWLAKMLVNLWIVRGIFLCVKKWWSPKFCEKKKSNGALKIGGKNPSS